MQAKDPRFDGRFFVGVKTTGVYCRPVCPVKSPHPRNVTFYPTAAAAAEAGYRPCLRCRPESSPGTPAWAGTSTTVNRALRIIGEGALDRQGVHALSDRLGVTPRHLSRLFMQHLGASPKAVAQTRRLHFAKKLLDETDLSMTEVALSAGYGSLRSFNDHFRRSYGRPPSSLRRHKGQMNGRGLAISLRYRPPYDFAGVLAFLGARGIPGVERVEGDCYSRNIRIDGGAGKVVIRQDAGRHQLCCEIDIASARSLMGIVSRIRRLFDLDADPMEIADCLGRDRALAPLVAGNPGRRIPGAWDAFEVAVRAIVGQQVSIKGATTVMGKVARDHGDVQEGLLFFPTPDRLADVSPDDLPMPRSRALAIKSMAQSVAAGDIDLSGQAGAEALIESLTAIKGIGPWTAHYIAMRALGDPDAFLHNDLVLAKIAKQQLGVETGRALLARAEAWRPWRAYAGMHLWSLAA